MFICWLMSGWHQADTKLKWLETQNCLMWGSTWRMTFCFDWEQLSYFKTVTGLIIYNFVCFSYIYIKQCICQSNIIIFNLMKKERRKSYNAQVVMIHTVGLLLVLVRHICMTLVKANPTWMKLCWNFMNCCVILKASISSKQGRLLRAKMTAIHNSHESWVKTKNN